MIAILRVFVRCICSRFGVVRTRLHLVDLPNPGAGSEATGKLERCSRGVSRGSRLSSTAYVHTWVDFACSIRYLALVGKRVTVVSSAGSPSEHPMCSGARRARAYLSWLHVTRVFEA